MKALLALGASFVLAAACDRGDPAKPGQPEPQEATCKFSMTLCEREAAGECQYQGYTVLGSYVENSTFQIPQYHLKYVCGRSGAIPSASVAPLGAPSAPPVASTPAAGPPAPAPSAGQIDPSWL